MHLHIVCLSFIHIILIKNIMGTLMDDYQDSTDQTYVSISRNNKDYGSGHWASLPPNWQQFEAFSYPPPF